MLNIVVCIKAVPDPSAADNIRIDPIKKSLTRMDAPLTINLLDRYALEAAVQLKAKYGAHITSLSMAPPEGRNLIKESLALGADKGILLTDPAFSGADAYATAFTLAKAIEKIGWVDAIFCGMASSDGATEWVGPEIATFLKMPVVTSVREIIEDQGDEWIVKADLTNGFRLVKVKLPALFTVTRDLNKPRQLRFSSILKIRDMDIIEWDRVSMGMSEESVGIRGSPTHVTKIAYYEIKRKAEMIEGSLDEKAGRLLEILTNAEII